MRRRTHFLRATALAAALLLATGLAAVEPLVRTLGWADLIPKLPPYDDPFTALTGDQLSRLGTIARAQEMQARGREPAPEFAARVREAESQLRSEGIDADALIARRDEVRAERQRRAEAIVPALDRQKIRMPGFVLPLEYAGRNVTEFLLVPWVGACIHTPPPPPNQIVHVRMAKGAEFEVKGLFEPVWVTGVLSTQSSRPMLSLVDGMADIPVGYALAGTGVEDYKP